MECIPWLCWDKNLTTASPGKEKQALDFNAEGTRNRLGTSNPNSKQYISLHSAKSDVLLYSTAQAFWTHTEQQNY